MPNWQHKEWRSEEEILFQHAVDRELNPPPATPPGTTFAGSGPVCSESLTPFPEKAKKLRTQNYW